MISSLENVHHHSAATAIFKVILELAAQTDRQLFYVYIASIYRCYSEITRYLI